MLQRSVLATKGSRQWLGIPAIERSANGRLWSACFSGGPKEPDEDNEILLTTSSDSGHSWRPLQTVIERSNGTRVFDPALWHDPRGHLWLIFNQANHQRNDHSLWYLKATDSGAGSPTWSESREIDLGVPYAFRLNKPTVLSSGDWLLPITWARTTPGDWFHRTAHLQGVAISSDQGETWRLHGALEAPQWALENMLVERRDNSIWMLIRTGSGLIWESTSWDGGRTWSKAQPGRIANPGSRFFIRRLHSGRLLLINSPNAQERTGLSTHLSDDDGFTWSDGLVIDTRPKVSYPDAVQAEDGQILAVYDHDRQGVGEIMFCTFTEADILR